jgi:chorismate-pyruvate lyase
MTETNTRPSPEILSPLAEVHQRVGRPLPSAVPIPADTIPEPYRSLLVHERDMTRTLENFHGRPIHLEVLNRRHEADGTYWREVVLRLDESNEPVEFGAILIFLDRFPEPWRSQILGEHLPLGAILNSSGLLYASKPSAYLRFECDGIVRKVFGLDATPSLYGRRNTLRDASGSALAEIIEILPPARV